MAELYLSCSGIALWINNKEEDRVIVKIIVVVNHFFCARLQLMCNFQYVVLVSLRIYEIFILRSPIMDDAVVDSDSEKYLCLSTGLLLSWTKSRRF